MYQVGQGNVMTLIMFLTDNLTFCLLPPDITPCPKGGHSERIFDGQKELRASIIFADLKPGQTRILSGRRWVWGRSVYVSALRLENGELLIIVSSDSSQTVISDYAKRWGIETLRANL